MAGDEFEIASAVGRCYGVVWSRKGELYKLLFEIVTDFLISQTPKVETSQAPPDAISTTQKSPCDSEITIESLGETFVVSLSEWSDDLSRSALLQSILVRSLLLSKSILRGSQGSRASNNMNRRGHLDAELVVHV